MYLNMVLRNCEVALAICGLAYLNSWLRRLVRLKDMSKWGS